MRKLRLLRNILVQTKAHRLLLSYLLFIFADAFVIFLTEPEITSYGDSLWYCYAVLTTAGFGDLVAVTFIGRIASVLLSVYSLLALAILTGVVVNYYTQIIEIQQKETLAAFADRLEQLPELSQDELTELSEQVHRFRTQLPPK